jgi:hypothetical protein
VVDRSAYARGTWAASVDCGCGTVRIVFKYEKMKNQIYPIVIVLI